MHNEIAEALGIKLSAFFAGLVGGVISLRFIAGLDTWWKKAGTVLGGAFAASYLSPLVVSRFGIQAGEGGVAFAIGLFAMSITAACIETIDKADFWALVKAKLGTDK